MSHGSEDLRSWYDEEVVQYHSAFCGDCIISRVFHVWSLLDCNRRRSMERNHNFSCLSEHVGVFHLLKTSAAFASEVTELMRQACRPIWSAGNDLGTRSLSQSWTCDSGTLIPVSI